MSSTYSFLDVTASLVGPGGAISLGSGAGAAEEGISVDPTEEINTMTVGADGSGMHTLHANKSGRVTVRLLKTSPTNGLLSAMYAFQTAGSLTHGQNTLMINDVARGEIIACRQVAFAKAPAVQYGKDAGVMEWDFNAVLIDRVLSST